MVELMIKHAVAGTPQPGNLLVGAANRAIHNQQQVTMQPPARGARHGWPQAPEDPRRACTPAAMDMLHSIYFLRSDTIYEWVELIDRRAERVPWENVPAVLTMGDQLADPLQARLISLVGERGRWLAAQAEDDRWEWALKDYDDLDPPIQPDTVVLLRHLEKRRKGLFDDHPPLDALGLYHRPWKKKIAKALVYSLRDHARDRTERPDLNVRRQLMGWIAYHYPLDVAPELLNTLGLLRRLKKKYDWLPVLQRVQAIFAERNRLHAVVSRT